MKEFMDEDFLLDTQIAKRLYHEAAEKTPILDYHCHLIPEEIAKDRSFENITQLWLGGDHYKWRLMRANGVAEDYITGDASDHDRFVAFAKMLPRAIGNPMVHWCHLELKRYFGYNGVLNEATAEEVWNLCNAKLREKGMSARNLIRNSGVTLVCTTDDPVDTLEWHRVLREDESFSVQVLPAWRPDPGMYPGKPGFTSYIERLSEASGVKITNFQRLCDAWKKRLEFFVANGCVLTDHGLDYGRYVVITKEQADEALRKGLHNESLSDEEKVGFQNSCMMFLAEQYKKLGLVMQLHYGAQRENDQKLYRRAGANAGLDCIDSSEGFCSEVAFFMNALSEKDALPKTILYSLNPEDNAIITTLIGCFQGATLGGVQQGSAWWFNDHKLGMRNQLETLASGALLGNFIGMLTDSRSFISYTRHEYFRRILCQYLGELVENGEYPNDMDTLKQLVKDISYNNAVRFFDFNLEVM